MTVHLMQAENSILLYGPRDAAVILLLDIAVGCKQSLSLIKITTSAPAV